MRNHSGRLSKMEAREQSRDAELIRRVEFVIECPAEAALIYGAQNVKRIHGLLDIAKRRKIAGLQDLKR